MIKVVKHWHRLPIETVDALTLELFNIKLDDSVTDIPAHCRGFGLADF